MQANWIFKIGFKHWIQKTFKDTDTIVPSPACPLLKNVGGRSTIGPESFFLLVTQIGLPCSLKAPVPQEAPCCRKRRCWGKCIYPWKWSPAEMFFSSGGPNLFQPADLQGKAVHPPRLCACANGGAALVQVAWAQAQMVAWHSHSCAGKHTHVQISCAGVSVCEG